MSEHIFAIPVGERSHLCQETSRHPGRQDNVPNIGALCHFGPGKSCLCDWLVRPVGVKLGSNTSSSSPFISFGCVVFLFF